MFCVMFFSLAIGTYPTHQKSAFRWSFLGSLSFVSVRLSESLLLLVRLL